MSDASWLFIRILAQAADSNEKEAVKTNFKKPQCSIMEKATKQKEENRKVTMSTG